MKKFKGTWMGRTGIQYTFGNVKKDRVVFHVWIDTNEIEWRFISGDGTKGTLVVYASGEYSGSEEIAEMQLFADAQLAGVK